MSICTETQLQGIYILSSDSELENYHDQLQKAKVLLNCIDTLDCVVMILDGIN